MDQGSSIFDTAGELISTQPGQIERNTMKQRVLTGAIAMTGLLALGAAVTPELAAASEPSVRVSVCNGNKRDQAVTVSGVNQNGQRVTTNGTAVYPPGVCGVILSSRNVYWWATGRSVQIQHWFTSETPRNTSCFIPKSAPNGSTVSCRIR
ncbi:hypothetical protein UK23_21755 [Lentzea aerocolonigenes]|uniref:Uncharacterized protein n=1 Tax=Lentzea aerocolonigenes TaxID=68170 RepID=A0A0F0GYA0_LENAE|nr:hypothetical protein UK23_21755 [Lentzea aerocolonigenes]